MMMMTVGYVGTRGGDEITDLSDDERRSKEALSYRASGVGPQAPAGVGKDRAS